MVVGRRQRASSVSAPRMGRAMYAMGG
jgi:hypothetical protein